MPISSATNTFLTLGGRVRCTQCRAKSKRTQQRCKAPVIKGKAVCRELLSKVVFQHLSQAAA